MKPSRLTVLFVVVSLACWGCGRRGAQASQQEAWNALIVVNGVVRIKRSGWNAYVPALFGTTVQAGDLIQVDGSASGSVVCSDLTVLNLVPGRVGTIPCRAPRTLLTYHDSPIVPTRGDSPPAIVYPAVGRVAGVRPELCWTAIADVPAYEISMEGPGVAWRHRVEVPTLMRSVCAVGIDCLSMRYPEADGALSVGQEYTFGVRAITGDAAPGTSTVRSSFQMLAPESQYGIEQAVTRIQGLHLDDGATLYLVGRLYLANGLIAEATQAARSLAVRIKEPAGERFLGDCYLAAGLARLAESAYERSLQASSERGDIEGEASALSSLGEIYAGNIFNPKEAFLRFTKASELYKGLGDVRKADELEARVRALSALRRR